MPAAPATSGTPIWGAQLQPFIDDRTAGIAYGAGAVNLIRAFILRHRALAFWMVLATLCVKAAVPAGYMIGPSSKVLTVQMCDDGSGNHSTAQLVIPMRDGGGDSGSKSGKGECAFASLSAASVAGADATQLALAFAFILILGLAPTPILHPKRACHLRPPLRGPPALV